MFSTSLNHCVVEHVAKVHIRVSMAVWCTAQHAILCSTAQHICALQHNATTGIIHILSIMPAAIRGQLGQLGTICIIWLEIALIILLGLNN